MFNHSKQYKTVYNPNIVSEKEFKILTQIKISIGLYGLSESVENAIRVLGKNENVLILIYDE